MVITSKQNSTEIVYRNITFATDEINFELLSFEISVLNIISQNVFLQNLTKSIIQVCDPCGHFFRNNSLDRN